MNTHCKRPQGNRPERTGAAGKVCAVAAMILCVAVSGWAGGKTLVQFNQTNGQWPSGPLIADGAGNLYGTTQGGGTFEEGVVFKLIHTDTGGWRETVLYNFGTNTQDGGGPLGGLVFDAKGNLYGTTEGGGSMGAGTVYELSRSSSGWTETIIYNFTGKRDGRSPHAGLVMDSAGNLYGTAEQGGGVKCYVNIGCGNVFKLSLSGTTWTLTNLHSFLGTNSSTNTFDGATPQGALVFDAAGNLYGTTSVGGQYDYGTVFELSASSGSFTYSVLYSFGGYSTDGAFPESSLILDASGNLYGTTFINVQGPLNGSVFELSPSGGTWTETLLYVFQGGTDGSQPLSPVTFDSAGNLYGTTSQGGDVNNCYQGSCGTVFIMTPVSGGGWKEAVLYHFTGGSDGSTPVAGLLYDGTGFFGTAQRAGNNDNGTVFEITP